MELYKNRYLFIYYSILIIFSIIAILVILVSLEGGEVKFDLLNSKDNKLNKRGDILDRNGTIIASDIMLKDLYINLDLIYDPNKLIADLENIFNDDYKDILTKINNRKRYKWILVKRNITPIYQEKIKKLHNPSLILTDNLTRIYPHNDLLSHIVGYCDSDRNGISSVELFYDNFLKENKEDLQLAVDINIQYIISSSLKEYLKKIKANKATAILMNVNNGEILSLVNIPTYNLNEYYTYKDNIRFNKATYGLYELGSVFKIFSNAAILEHNISNLEDKIDISNEIIIGKYKISDNNKINNKYEMSVKEIFAKSSNIGTVNLIKKLGKKKHMEFLKKVNLLNKLNADFPSLAYPIIPKKIRNINSYTISYGHGIAITPLHLISSVSAMVNGGIYYNPSFIKIKDNIKGKRVITSETSEKIRELMKEVVENGTARNGKIKNYNIGGKTGTAEIIKYGNYDEEKHILSFVSSFPIDNPKYAMLITIYDSQSEYNNASAISVPISKNIIKKLLLYLKITG